MKLFISLALSILSCGCSNHYTLSEFSYNNKKYNSCILNRKPDYGDGRPDGCIIMPELELSLFSSDTSLTGKLTDVYKKEPIKNGTINFYFTNEVVPVVSNSEGIFRLPKKDSLEKIEVFVIGYRRLNIDLSKKKIFRKINHKK